MGWWKDWGRYAAVGLSVAAGAVVSLASGGALTPLAAAGVGALTAGVGLGATALIDNALSTDEEISIQEETLGNNMKADAIGFITNDELSLDSYLKDIDSYLQQIEAQSLIVDRNQQNIDVNNEWLAMYQGMLNGEDNLLTQERNLLDSQIAQATAAKGLADQVLVQQRNAAEAYLQSSQIEKDNASRQGFMSYAEMMKQKSLANVVAGATGGIRSSFSANAINQQNEIRRYIGDDLKFNVGGEGEGAGTFAREFGMLKTAIDNQILANNISIQAAQNDVTRASDSIDAATFNLNKQLDAWDTNRSALEQDNADKKAAIDIDKASIERWTTLVDGFQDEAIRKLQSWQNSAADAGRTKEEIDSFVNDTKKKFKDFGYEI